MERRIESAVFEVELSSDDLFTLSQSRAARKHTTLGRRSLTYIGVAASIGVVAVVATLIAYRGAETAPIHEAVSAPVLQAEAPLPQPSIPEAVQPPVRFANPFDRHEIFEFPAGTSSVEARDKVAELLMERARGRRSHEPHRRVAVAHQTSTARR